MSRRESLAHLRSSNPVILPSLLLCDFAELRSEIERVEAAGARALHLDVMDGHFVPNFTYGMTIVEAVRRCTRLPLDVHLMISQPQRWVQAFREAGADVLTVHVEATGEETAETLEAIRSQDMAAGLALNPSTPLTAVADHLSHCDLLLVMSVEAGFGGQKFNPVALDRLRQVRAQHPDLLLEIDGGINAGTLPESAAAGATLFVVGSAIFDKTAKATAVGELTELARASQTLR